MFCQSEALANHSSHPSVVQSKSSLMHERILPKQEVFDFQAISLDGNGFSQQQIAQNDKFASADKHDGSNSNKDVSKLQLHRLERDVFGLQEMLQQEVDLHYVLENAFVREAGALSELSNLPNDAKKLVSEVAMLEMAISSLEEQIASLNLQLGVEKRERLVAQSTLVNPRFHNQEVQRKNQECCQSLATLQTCSLSANSLPIMMSSGSFSLSTPRKNTCIQQPLGSLTSPIEEGSVENFSSTSVIHPLPDNLVHHFQLKSRSSPFFKDMPNKIVKPLQVKHSWNHPNKLSEEMVKCMINIYRRLSDVDALSLCTRVASPSSPYGNNTFSISSLSETSSSTRSPTIDTKNKDFERDKCSDPYHLPDKISWSNIGTYGTSVDVSDMFVGKEQLEYAAEALRMFRSLVEQLSRVNPGIMNHNEKLAFWINVYNALMMHAYLAYGVPKNDFKFFSLMQKAAYTVGCHSFNAVVIEHLLLKAKAQWYRPQIALLLAHQKLKLREEVSMFAIDCVEPLVAFSLSFGARSSPAVRVYTAGNVHNELQAAMQDYAQAAVGVSTKGKVLIPKLLHDFGLDVVEEAHLLDWLCHVLPCHQANLIQSCRDNGQFKSLSSKIVSVVPFDFRFRYLFLEQIHRPECR